MVLIRILERSSGKRDKREEEIKSLLQKASEESHSNNIERINYLNQAKIIKEKIEREKGQIYFKKYPEIPKMINETTNKLIEYES